MKKIINNFLVILAIILISIFAGYENPGLVEMPKKYVHFLLKKIGLRDNFLNKKINNEDFVSHEKNEFTEIKGNSFSFILSKVRSFKGKSASLIIKRENAKEAEYEIFTQDGFLVTKKDTF